MAGLWPRAVGLWIAWVCLGLAVAQVTTNSASASPITLHTRWRTGSTNLAEATPHEGSVAWEASRTAVVVCDMWDSIIARMPQNASGKWPRP